MHRPVGDGHPLLSRRCFTPFKERLLLAWEQWWPWLGCARAGIRAWWRRCNRRRAIPWAQTGALAKERTTSGNNGSVAIRSVSDPESWERYVIFEAQIRVESTQKSIKEAREHVHITGEVVPQPTDRSADR